MQLTEREFRATQPLDRERDGARVPVRRASSDLLRPPRTVFQALSSLVRANATFALVTPVVVGAVLAWWEVGLFDPAAFVFSVVGLAAAGWGFSALSDYLDFRRSTRPGARAQSRPTADPLYDGFGLMERAVLRPQIGRDLGLILLAASALCSIALAVLVGWPILFFGGLSLIVLAAVLLLPLKYGHHGWGAGESGIFLGLGWLPALGAYYAQAHQLTWLPIWASLPLGLLTALLFLNYNTIHYRRDWLIHKRTLAVNLGLARSLDLSALLTVLAHIGILLVVTLTDLPLLALIALAALPVGLGVFSRVERDDFAPDDCLAVYQTGAHAGVITGLLFCAALLIDKLV